jgi:hypothetical protein
MEVAKVVGNEAEQCAIMLSSIDTPASLFMYPSTYLLHSLFPYMIILPITEYRWLIHTMYVIFYCLYVYTHICTKPYMKLRSFDSRPVLSLARNHPVPWPNETMLIHTQEIVENIKTLQLIMGWILFMHISFIFMHHHFTNEVSQFRYWLRFVHWLIHGMLGMTLILSHQMHSKIKSVGLIVEIILRRRSLTQNPTQPFS